MLRRSIRLLYPAKGLCNYIKPHSNLGKVLYSTYDKDFPNPSLPTPSSKLYSHDTDILMEQIKRAKTIERLLELTSMHLQVMNAKHIVQSMNSIHEFIKEPDFSNDALTKNEIFQGLCSRLMKIVRLLDPQEVITVYKALSTLGIRNNTYVMQSVLKMMGAHLNNMTLGQLTFLHFLLSKQKPNSIVDGLKLALPLVLQVQIEQQLDSDNVTEIINCLQLACRSRLKPAVIEKVLTAVIEKVKFMSPSDAVSVTFALLNLDTPVNGYKELLNYCFELLSKNGELLNQKQTISILRLCRSQGHYDSSFLFAIAEKIISENWNFEQTYEMISHFHRMKFAPQFFLDYFVNMMCLDSDTLNSKINYSPLNCIEYLTLTGYRPSRIEEALEMLCSCEEKIFNLKPNLYTKFLCCISTLGYFPQKHLETILDENSLFNAWTICKKQGRANDYETHILSLAWSLQVYDQQENFKFPNAVLKKLISTLCQKHEDYQSPLESFIKHGLGGSQFIENGLLTKEGIFIDHVLAMRSGNYPVSLQPTNVNESPFEKSNRIKFVEDIKLPEEAKIIAIIVAEEDKYCRDPEVLKGWMDLKIQCLRKKKYFPVVINYGNFKLIPDREKIPFLMHEIKLAIEENNVNTSSLNYQKL